MHKNQVNVNILHTASPYLNPNGHDLNHMNLVQLLGSHWSLVGKY